MFLPLEIVFSITKKKAQITTFFNFLTEWQKLKKIVKQLDKISP